MRYQDLRILLLGVLALLICGCSSVDPEPEVAFKDIAQQAYPFDVVFESMAEAVQSEEFVIETNERRGDAAEFKTNFKMTGKDKITGVEESTRIRVRIAPAGEKFSVGLAASIFNRDTPIDPWVYMQRDEALAGRIEGSLAGILTRRYQGGGE